MPNLTKTQSLILIAGAQRADIIAMPLPKGLHGAAAKKVVTMMCERGWLEEVDANTRKGEPLWRETGDGHGTTLAVTDAGLLAVGIDPVVVKTKAAVRQNPIAASRAKTPTPRTNTKQAQIITLLQRPAGASIAEIVEVTGWLPHTARGVVSGALKKRPGLEITTSSNSERGRIYHIT
jgi:hypothetical protein